MVKLLLILLLCPLGLEAKCLKLDDLKVEAGIKIIKVRHVLMYVSDTCGARGCEIELYSKDPAGCFQNSLTTKGFLIPESFSESEVRISINAVPTKFKFNESRMKFEK